MQGETDIEFVQAEDDFDTGLLCPDVIIEENNDTILTHTGEEYVNTSSPLDYNITGVKAQFKLNDTEERLRAQIYKPGTPIQNTKIHCTACNAHLGSALNSIEDVYIHPLMFVLLCKGCFDYYTGGGFTKDSDGAEMYCRWCGQGGQVFCCSKCPMVFCKMCVRLNFNCDQYKNIRDSSYWECFSCNPIQVVHLKVQCFEFIQYIIKELLRVRNDPKAEIYKMIDHSQCCMSESRKRKQKNNDPDFTPEDEEIKKPKIAYSKTNTPYADNVQKVIDELVMSQIVNKVGCTTITNAAPQVSSFKPICAKPIPNNNLEIVHLQTKQMVNNFVNQLPCNQNMPGLSRDSISILKPPLLPKQLTPIRFQCPQNLPKFTPIITPNMPGTFTITNASGTLFRTITTNQPVRPPGYTPVKNEDLRALMLNKQALNLNKQFLSIALSSSSFASTMLSLYQLANDVKTIPDMIAVYESLQKSLKAMTDSLRDAKNGQEWNDGRNLVTTGAARVPASK